MEEYIRKLKERFIKWGHDREGDLTLKVGPIYFTFYKWSSPIIWSGKRVGFVPMNDMNSKGYYHLYKKGE